MELLRELKAGGASIAAYGAAAKGTVLLNHVGIDDSLVDFVVDRNPHKQGLYMPGVHLPIRAPEALLELGPTTCSCSPGTTATRSCASRTSTAAGAGALSSRFPSPRSYELVP